VINIIYQRENFQYLKPDQIKKYLFSSREVIEIQSRLYYNINPNLGFKTLADTDEKYPIKIAELILEFTKQNPENRLIRILELGPGTGRFFERLVKYLQSKKMKIHYTMVDITTKKHLIQLKSIYGNLSIIEKSFFEFANSNNNSFDIIIANEALDMWAGDNQLFFENNFKKSISIGWILHNLAKNTLLSQKETKKININTQRHDFMWEKIYLIYENNKSSISFSLLTEGQEKIAIPKELGKLLSNLEIFAIFQDYWSYGDSNPLRAGFSKKLLEEFSSVLIKYSSALGVPGLANTLKEQLSKKSNEFNQEKYWLETQLIPFGSVDVTYTPDQFEFMKMNENLGFTLSKFDIVTYRDDNDFESLNVLDSDKEIFLLITQKALKMQLNS